MNICEHDLCCGCGACTAVCKFNCITLKENSEGFWYPEIDEAKCRNCGICRKVCPENKETFSFNPASFYMAWNKDEETLLHSSSGGVFSALAQYVFDKKGCVFGASVDFETHDVFHSMIDMPEDLYKFRYSKYYQSDASYSYEQVKELLDNGRWVLYSGTACQVAALYQYLGNINKEKLLTMDVLCHGVTSKKVFEKYLESKEKAYKSKVVKYSFRVKNDDIWWSKGSTMMMMMMMDGTTRYEHLSRDTFFTAFNKNVILRESCYHCKFCGTDRISDFTAADFWGIKPDMVDEKQMKNGVSLFLINSDKAKEILPEIEKYLQITPIDKELPISHNLALVRPNTRPENRDKFFSMIGDKDFDRIIKTLYVKKYVKEDIKSISIKLLGEEKFEIVKNFLKRK